MGRLFAFRKMVAMNLEFLKPLEVKLAADTGLLEGYASTFGNVDSYGDVIAPGAFLKSLAEHKAAGTAPALLWQHNPDEPIGVWTDFREDTHGLKVAGRLTLDTKRGAEARALARDGALALSIGFQSRDAVNENGRRVLRDIKLWEVSLVTFPANELARLTTVKSAIAAGELSPRTIEHILRDAGVPKAFAKAIVAGGWKTASSNRCDAEGEVHRLCEAVKANTAMLNSYLRIHQHGTPGSQSRD
jgi:HK97 family phage prohead protease